jgi:hypothetical protein
LISSFSIDGRRAGAWCSDYQGDPAFPSIVDRELPEVARGRFWWNWQSLFQFYWPFLVARWIFADLATTSSLWDTQWDPERGMQPIIPSAGQRRLGGSRR